MAVCNNCGKKPQFGNNVSFSMRHTKRQFKPNLRKTKVMQGGKLVSVTLCAKCIKAMSKDAVR
jgi:large subunit ribosomal protein L28